MPLSPQIWTQIRTQVLAKAVVVVVALVGGRQNAVGADPGPTIQGSPVLVHANRVPLHESGTPAWLPSYGRKASALRQ